MWSEQSRLSCTPDKDIWYFTLGLKILFYHAILPRLLREGYIHWLYWNSLSWFSSDIIVMLKWRHHMKLHQSLFRDFWKLIWKLKKQWWARKRIQFSCEGMIEESVPPDYPLSSLGKRPDAKRWSSGQIFLSHPHTHDRFLQSSGFQLS